MNRRMLSVLQVYLEKKYPHFKIILKTQEKNNITSDLLCCIYCTIGEKTNVKVQYNNNKSGVTQLGNWCTFTENTPMKDLKLAADKIFKGIMQVLNRGWFKIGTKRKKYYDKFLDEWSYKYIAYKRVYFKKWEFV